ncbi:MAG: hypothetical protein KAT61_03650, partial [Gammaproteobacteria bacterium]|nr:hypothetical protein [Gammaproteobacteria bacterium]
YRKLPWDQTSVHCNQIGDCFVSNPDEIEQLTPIMPSNSINQNGMNEATDNVISDEDILESSEKQKKAP